MWLNVNGSQSAIFPFSSIALRGNQASLALPLTKIAFGVSRTIATAVVEPVDDVRLITVMVVSPSGGAVAVVDG